MLSTGAPHCFLQCLRWLHPVSSSLSIFLDVQKGHLCSQWPPGETTQGTEAKPNGALGRPGLSPDSAEDSRSLDFLYRYTTRGSEFWAHR